MLVDSYLRLHQEYRVIYLLNHRNKNQHRVAIWWKWFNMMKRNVAGVVEVVQRISRSKKGPIDQDVRILYRLLHKFFKMEDKLYYSFNGVIQLGQFMTVGIVLVGLLARVHTIYRELFDNHANRFQEIGCIKVPQYSEKVDDYQPMDSEELGELIEESEVIEHTPKPIKKTAEVNTVHDNAGKGDKKKKKKKKKTSAIDDLFG
ncbi:Ribonuclease MRP protein subunit RMP1 [Nakaseomyces bracarensis]|uniref:Ribonuclease MRP protein subunit RMP1 n=1 Tax=Nakaseomyces bracarensis TaxID=273131 RepID=A0ABR4NRR7_9SACH